MENKKNNSGFHYFVHDSMNRSEKIQATVVTMLLKSDVPQEKRESSVQWELRHLSGVIQFARMLAQKRDVDIELAEVSATLHDIAVIVTGSYHDHGAVGGLIARKLLANSDDFSEIEIQQIVVAVESHSNKQIFSENKLVELIKDADLFDVFLYNDQMYDYKGDDIISYYKRIISLRKELNLPEKQYFNQQLLLRGVH